jgi:GDP-L-fucose synthase
MHKEGKIFLAGHLGLVGSAILRRLQAENYSNLVLRTQAELDLTVQDRVERFFEGERPDCVILAAAKVGGILANAKYPADFIRDNLLITANVIDAAWRHGAQQLLFLGSSCIYPKMAPQPLKEEYLLTGPLEPTNEAYAVAKITGVKMCQAYQIQHGFNAICLMPTNLYGPGDNFDLETSHVLPALIRKFHDARCNRSATVEIWGSGRPRREFLHVDDLADACVFLLQLPIETVRKAAPDSMLNVGTGTDIEIRELALLIRRIVGSDCDLRFDPSKPDGTPRKLLDVTRLQSLGWGPRVSLEDGIRMTYQWYCNRQDSLR